MVRRRFGPRTADLIVVAISLMVAVAAILASPEWVDVPRWLVAAAGAVGTVSLLRRRRWPIWVTVVGIATFLLTQNPIVMVAGLYTTAVRARDRVLLAVAAAGAAAFAVFDVIDEGRFYVGMVVSGIGRTLMVVAVGAYVGARRDLVASLRDRADRAEAERELRAEQAKAGERARIAREMHDVLAHKVSLIALHAGALEVNADAGSERVEEAAALIRTTAHQTLEELREVLGVLRSDAGAEGTDLSPTATAGDIGRLVEASRAAGVAVTLAGTVPDLPDGTARAVYRVVQEALTNVHKHARGAATEVAVAGNERSGVTVSVVNVRPVAADLLLDPIPGSGAGLVGLAERTRLLGGTFASGPTSGGGWAVGAWLPWHGTADHVPSDRRDGVSIP